MTAQLDANQQLNTNDKLVADNNTTTLIMQEDGNLALYRNEDGAVLWSSKTSGKPVTHAIMQADGNFVCYDNSGAAYWSTGTWGNPGAFIILQDDGNLVVYRESGVFLWASKTALGTEQLNPNQQLNTNDKVVAANRRTTLVMQDDGNLVLYRNYDGLPLFASNTPGKPVTHAIMQGDGNFVCYDDNGVAYWSTSTSGNPDAYLLLQDDGNLVVNALNGPTLWASNTAQNWDLADPGPPAILIEVEPALLINVNDASELASFIDAIQSAIAPAAPQLQAVGLALAGPSAVAADNPSDNAAIVRVGLWLLSPYFPFAAQDPNHPHQLPVLTPICAATGFSQAALLGVPEQTSLEGASFALSIPVTALNTLAKTALPKIQAWASKIGASANSVAVTCSPPSPFALTGGNVVTTVECSWGVPPAAISGTITETLGLQDLTGTAPDTTVPMVTGTLSSGTDVGNQVLLGAADALGGAGLLGIPLSLEAPAITILVPLGLSGLVGPVLAQVSALVNMLPPVLPFEPPRPTDQLPDFPKLIFNWTWFVATTPGIIGKATVTVVQRKAGSGSVTLSGPTVFDGFQADMAGGASADYTVTWTDIAPTTFDYQVNGPTGDSAGSITAKVFPFNQSFVAEFPLPDDVSPGQYRFRMTTTATEVNVNNTSETLTASANHGVIVHVRKNPKDGPP